MNNPHTEARAIAEDAYDNLAKGYDLDGIDRKDVVDTFATFFATVFAAKDAELAAVKAKCQALDDECQKSVLDIARERDRAERALAERAGGVKVDDLAQEIRRVDGSNSLGAGALAEALMPFLSTEPAAPEGRQDDGHTDADGYPYEYTRPAEQAVTEAMVERLAQHLAMDHVAIDDRAEYSWHSANEQWRQSWRRKASAALKAAMEAGR